MPPFACSLTFARAWLPDAFNNRNHFEWAVNEHEECFKVALKRSGRNATEIMSIYRVWESSSIIPAAKSNSLKSLMGDIYELLQAAQHEMLQMLIHHTLYGGNSVCHLFKVASWAGNSFNFSFYFPATVKTRALHAGLICSCSNL